MTRLSAASFVVLAAVLWGLVGVVIRAVLDAGVGALEVAFWRCLFAGGLFCLHARSTRSLKLHAPADLGALAAFALLVNAAHYVTFNVAVLHGGVGLINLLLATLPALIALGAALSGNPPRRTTLALVGVSVLGLVLAAGGGGAGVTVSALSVGVGLVAALTLAAYTLWSKELLTRYSPAALNAFVMPLSALALLPFVGFHVGFGAKSPEVWGWLVVLGVFPTYLAHLLYQTGLKHLSPTRAALLASLEVPVALLTAAFVGERFSGWGVVGVALVLGAPVLAAFGDRGGAALPRPPAHPRRRERRVRPPEPAAARPGGHRPVRLLTNLYNPAARTVAVDPEEV